MCHMGKELFYDDNVSHTTTAFSGGGCGMMKGWDT